MTPFLKQVAVRYVQDGKISGSCFIFPNRRSMVFFRKYLAQTLADGQDAVPVATPVMMTENDFFYSLNHVPVTDRITLLLRLYDCYKELNPRAEPLDEFIFWGDIILGDFNDTDKYLADPHQIFTNIADFKSIQDNYEYLTPGQREAIEKFIGHFNERNSRLTADIGSDKPDVKARFLQIWNLLERMYRSFNDSLREDGLAYEGMVYRGAVNMLSRRPVADILAEAFPSVSRFVFVGLNALNECEKAVMSKMRDSALAEFCWDWSSDMIKDRRNKSSLFMAENVSRFPQADDWDESPLGTPQINVVSVPSSVGQVKTVPGILERLPLRVSDRSDSAIVLSDEHLLLPLLNSIPPEIQDINVTMGYSMSSSSFYSLMSDISAMQLHLRNKDGQWSFYYRQAWSVFSNGIFRKVADASCNEIIDRIKSEKRIYIPQEDFSGHWLLELIFRPAFTDLKAADASQTVSFSKYLLEVTASLASKFGASDGMALETEFAKAYYCDVTRLSSFSLPVLPLTYVRLLDQIVSDESVPFKGEPLKGLQIMGPLETRALDFTNLVILSANEGSFPRRSVSSSFIPAELRRGFGLPTYEHQDAVWAYYFYRMIQRAENVWLVYDSRTEGLNTGEESRYIRQLTYHFKIPVKRYVSGAGTGETVQPEAIPKTEEDIRKIRGMSLSASVLKNYLQCPAKFYYGSVKHLETPAEVSETLDRGMFGTVYHNLMWALFAGEEEMAGDRNMNRRKQYGADGSPVMEKITREYLVSWLGREDAIRRKVRSLICNEIRTTEITGRNLVVANVIVSYVLKTIERDIELLDSRGADSFRLIGAEKGYGATFAGYRFSGYIDRIDSLSPGQIRVSDYKTGTVLKDDISIEDGNAEEVVEKIFGDNNDSRPDIALQFFIYDMLLRANGCKEEILNSVYHTTALFNSPVEAVPVSEKFYSLMTEKLTALLGEMGDVNIPFRRTGDEKTCGYCDFKKICGK